MERAEMFCKLIYIYDKVLEEWGEICILCRKCKECKEYAPEDRRTCSDFQKF